MPHPQFAGSKRKIRQAERDASRVRAVNARLNRIRELAHLLTSDEELDRYLAEIADDAVRIETRKLIEPFCLFKIQRVELASPVDVVDAIERTDPSKLLVTLH